MRAATKDSEEQQFPVALHHDLLWGLTELIWPSRCVLCDMPGDLVCEQCRAELPWIAQHRACPICGAPHGWLTCTSCGAEQVRARWAKKGAHEVNEDAQWESCERERHEWVFHEWESHATICALEFAGSGARLATCFKDAHEVRLSPIIAALMATALDEAEGCLASDGRPRLKHDELDVLCYIPATRAAYIRRGFDHMELVAHDLSAMIGLPVADALVKTSSTDQRLLNREDRAHNLKGTIQVVEDVSGAHVVLVDDVITTGATIREATRELLSHGALEVTCCALARAW